MADWQLPWTGGCRCGRVRIRITAPPMLTTACHCTDCQRMSASDHFVNVRPTMLDDARWFYAALVPQFAQHHDALTQS